MYPVYSELLPGTRHILSTPGGGVIYLGGGGVEIVVDREGGGEVDVDWEEEEELAGGGAGVAGEGVGAGVTVFFDL